MYKSIAVKDENMSQELLISKSFWNGYERHDFIVNGREAIVVLPEKAIEGKPWIWRVEFFDAFAQADLAMLEKGWYLAYYKVSDMYGSQEAVELMREFHSHMEIHYGLSKQAVLFGFSRGGLYAFNYAAQYPSRVSTLYLDAPVLDIKSWPGGKGVGEGGQDEWRECLACYGLTEETVMEFKGNPLDKIDQVLNHNIPIIIVAGDADTVVPYQENAAILAKYYNEKGGRIKVILKQGCGHHPHSLENPAPIVDFICLVHS